MKNNLLDIKSLVQKETLEVISKLLKENNIEKQRQDNLVAQIKYQGLEHEKHHGKKSEEEKKEEDEETLDKTNKDKSKEKEIKKNIDKSFDKSLKPEGSEEEKSDDKKHPGTKDSPKLKTPDEKTIQNPSFEEIVNKLNILRGGKSLSNKDIQNSLRKYFSGLNQTEKSTLLVLLTAVSQILAGTETGETALGLHDAGIDIENKSQQGVSKDQIKSSEKPEKKGQEKTVQPTKDVSKQKEKETPIIKIGEHQDKERMYKIFESYKKNY